MPLTCVLTLCDKLIQNGTSYKQLNPKDKGMASYSYTQVASYTYVAIDYKVNQPLEHTDKLQ